MAQSPGFFARLQWRLCVPEYVFQPFQLVRRMRGLGPRFSPRVVRLPWGAQLQLATNELITNRIARTGVYDLVVSETIWRLLDPGEGALDVGAHIGYMTSIMAARAGQQGRVSSFEPQPDVAAELRRNVAAFPAGFAPIDITNAALSHSSGKARMVAPVGWSRNRGSAHLATTEAADSPVAWSYDVDTYRLDDLFADGRRFGLAKLDVEGHEHDVLRGAERLLSTGAIRDIVFEDLGHHPTAVMRLLEEQGYTIFSLGKTFWRPRLGSPDRSDIEPMSEPNYLATRDSGRARQRLARRGWLVLRGRAGHS